MKLPKTVFINRLTQPDARTALRWPIELATHTISQLEHPARIGTIRAGKKELEFELFSSLVLMRLVKVTIKTPNDLDFTPQVHLYALLTQSGVLSGTIWQAVTILEAEMHGEYTHNHQVLTSWEAL